MPTDSSPTAEWLRCPRCERAELATASGSGLLDSPCWSCGGTFLPPAGVARLIHDEHGIDVATLRALMGEHAGTQLRCPACRYAMSHLQVKGVPIELCSGCGGVWLDEGELQRLSFGRYSSARPQRPAPPEPVYTKPVPAEPIDAEFEPVRPEPGTAEPGEAEFEPAVPALAPNRNLSAGGCLRAVATLYAGVFAVMMFATAVVTGAWQLGLVGAVALALAVRLGTRGRWGRRMFRRRASARQLP